MADLFERPDWAGGSRGGGADGRRRMTLPARRADPKAKDCNSDSRNRTGSKSRARSKGMADRSGIAEKSDRTGTGLARQVAPAALGCPQTYSMDRDAKPRRQSFFGHPKGWSTAHGRLRLTFWDSRDVLPRAFRSSRGSRF